eukprot:gnl/Dysnectes_brevis/3649_a4656_923.p1 GENE.gnl/Dysnectes_brevis/3649_a4656_923~~gnl/Dysnectes_brevis/3649_a4656_923.p1  ORF type:complete len:685 (+),score=211.49 gnl/Dysnectes_brevis/3649_a4656_923:137-2191(+)
MPRIPPAILPTVAVTTTILLFISLSGFLMSHKNETSRSDFKQYSTRNDPSSMTIASFSAVTVPLLQGSQAPQANFIDTTQESVSIDFDGTWAPDASALTTLFTDFYKFDTDSGQSFLLVRDRDWTEDGVDIPNNRSVDGAVYCRDGEFSNGDLVGTFGKGVFYNNTQRIAMQLKLPSWSPVTEFTLNTSEAGADPSAQWPDPTWTNVDEEADWEAVLGQMSLEDCEFAFYGQYTTGVRPTVRHLPDWEGVEQGRDAGDGQEEVPAFEGVLVSQNCGVRVEAGGLIYNSENDTRSAIKFAVIASVFALWNLHAGIRLLIASSSPARVKRLSLISLGFITIADCYVAIITLSLAITAASASFPALMLMTSLEFILCAIVDLQLILERYSHHLQDRGQALNSASLVRVYCLFYGSMVLALALAFYLPTELLLVGILALSTFWLPQTLFSIKTGDPRVAYQASYLLSASANKLFVPLYFLTWENNFVHMEVFPSFAYVLTGWVALQLLIVALQSLFGPRFFICGVKKSEGMYAYDKQLLPEAAVRTLVEAGAGATVRLPFKPEQYNAETSTLCSNPLHSHSPLFAASATPRDVGVTGEGRCFALVTEDKITSGITCSICLDSLDLRTAQPGLLRLERDEWPGEGHPGDAIWVTPCGHVFHGACLSEWMDQNSVCPIDRAAIPPAPASE